MTEAEAKTKWCPFVRCGPYGTNRLTPESMTGDQPLGVSPIGPCIGSACMAWIWGEPRIIEDVTIGDKQATEAQGYCGLARQS